MIDRRFRDLNGWKEYKWSIRAKYRYLINHDNNCLKFFVSSTLLDFHFVTNADENVACSCETGNKSPATSDWSHIQYTPTVYAIIMVSDNQLDQYFQFVRNTWYWKKYFKMNHYTVSIKTWTLLFVLNLKSVSCRWRLLTFSLEQVTCVHSVK